MLYTIIRGHPKPLQIHIDGRLAHGQKWQRLRCCHQAACMKEGYKVPTITAPAKYPKPPPRLGPKTSGP
eukprot:scaffold205325_cov27-Tisochrysis_lutea.AAC.2